MAFSTFLLFAQSTEWPTTIDIVAIVVFVAIVVLAPLIGFWLTSLDILAYLRALKGVLVRIAYPDFEIPAWLESETPPCLKALGLSLPCTEEELRSAYRELAKKMHPDRGGDIQRFLLLQQHFEQSLNYLRQRTDDS
ncbi:MAG: J domain-containing protein [Planctomycetaceae bacterium]|nr:J domain-containing protein [Planctomycetaceae bacterium]